MEGRLPLPAPAVGPPHAGLGDRPRRGSFQFVLIPVEPGFQDFQDVMNFRVSKITKTPLDNVQGGFCYGKGRQRPTLPRSRPRSTIGAEELNDRVRDGNGCGLLAIATAPKGTGESVDR